MKFTLFCSILVFANAFNSKRTVQFHLPGQLNSFAMLLGSVHHELTDFTLCHWSKTNKLGGGNSLEAVFSYFIPRREDSIATTLKHNKFVQVCVESQCVTTEPTLSNDDWIHLCTTWSLTDNTFGIFLNGQNAFHRALNTTSNPIPAGGVVFLGLVNKFEYPLKGQVSEVNLWDYKLTPNEVAQVYKCQDEFEGNIIGWSNSVWTMRNDKTNISHVSLPCGKNE